MSEVWVAITQDDTGDVLGVSVHATLESVERSCSEWADELDAQIASEHDEPVSKVTWKFQPFDVDDDDMGYLVQFRFRKALVNETRIERHEIQRRS